MRAKRDPAPTVALLTEFDRLHLERLGVRAVIRRGKDARLVADLVASHGAEMVRELIGAFFATSDPWILARGFTVGVFISQAGKLLAARVRAGEAWEAECDRIHGGACESGWVHRHRKRDENGGRNG